MFIGHFALGFAAKRAAPRVQLAVLFTAAQLADLLWPFLLALGLEQVRIDPGNTALTPLDFVSYPYSHSLLLLIVWGALSGAVYHWFAPQHRGAFAVIAGLVVSHWVLDALTHRADMPLYPGGPKVGLGLWNSVAGTMTIELLMYSVGVWIYARATQSQDRVGRWAFWGLAVFLVIAYVANIVGGPPPSVTALYLAALPASLLLLLWSWWVDAHRTTNLEL